MYTRFHQKYRELRVASGARLGTSRYLHPRSALNLDTSATSVFGTCLCAREPQREKAIGPTTRARELEKGSLVCSMRLLVESWPALVQVGVSADAHELYAQVPMQYEDCRHVPPAAPTLRTARDVLHTGHAHRVTRFQLRDQTLDSIHGTARYRAVIHPRSEKIAPAE